MLLATGGQSARSRNDRRRLGTHPIQANDPCVMIDGCQAEFIIFPHSCARTQTRARTPILSEPEMHAQVIS